MTFLQPLFLIGLSLSIVPIVIHLWFRKRLRKIPFSTLTFLKRTEAKRFGWLRLREIIILLLRCLAIACLFFALARPRVAGTLFRTGRLASVVLVLDNSGSMDYGERFAAAQHQAQEAIAQYSPRSEFMVVPLCLSAGVSDSLSWTNQRSAAQRISAIPLSYSSGRIAELYRRISFDNARYRVEFLYIGDGQETVFSDFPEELAAGHPFLMTTMPDGSNTAITRVILKDPVAVPLESYGLLISVGNYSEHLWHGTISVTAGEFTAEQECTVSAESEIPVEFRIPVGQRYGTVRLYDDSLSMDNIYYFAKTPGRRLHVLIIGSDTFLRPALLPVQTTEAPFTVVTTPQLAGIDLRQYDVIVLNTQGISSSDKLRLETFVDQADKSIICCLGDTVLQHLAEFIGTCTRPESLILPQGYVTLDWIDLDHPVFSVFSRNSDLQHARFFRFYATTPRGEVIARLTGRHPFITLTGNLAVVSAPFRPEATDIVYKATFVPLLHRLIVSTTIQEHDREFYVDDIMKHHETMRTPSGELLMKDQPYFMPGFHTAGGSTVAVNIGRTESNLKPLGTAAAHALDIQQIDFKRDIGAQDLTTFFLLCTLGALLLELLLLVVR